MLLKKGERGESNARHVVIIDNRSASARLAFAKQARGAKRVYALSMSYAPHVFTVVL